jgi:hypothetical protein
MRLLFIEIPPSCQFFSLAVPWVAALTRQLQRYLEI